MGASNSKSLSDGIERPAVFLNPGDPEIFKVSPYALVEELRFTPKNLNPNYKNFITSELLISIFNNYKQITQEKSKRDLFIKILIPSLAHSIPASDESIDEQKQLISFENEKLNFFIEKEKLFLKTTKKTPKKTQELIPLDEKFIFAFKFEDSFINTLVSEEEVRKFINKYISSISLNFSTIQSNRKISERLINMMDNNKNKHLCSDAFAWAVTIGDVPLMLKTSVHALNFVKKHTTMPIKVDEKRFIPSHSLMKHFNPAKANQIGRFILDQFVPETPNSHQIIAASWDYVFATDGHILMSVDLNDSFTLRQSRFKAQPLPQGFANKKTAIANVDGNILIISSSQLAVMSTSPVTFSYKEVTYQNRKETISLPFTTDGTFIYSYQSKGCQINVFNFELTSVKKIHSIKLRESGIKLQSPYEKELVPSKMAKSCVMFCDGLVLHFITFEKASEGSYQHFVRTFSILDGFHIGDSTFNLDIPIFSLSFNSLQKTYWAMTVLDKDVGFAQYQYNGPISPSSTHLYAHSLLLDHSLMKAFTVSKMNVIDLSWEIPFYIGSMIISLVGLPKATIIKNFSVFYYLLNDETIVPTIIDIIPVFISYLQFSKDEKYITVIKIFLSLMLVNIEITGIKLEAELLNKLIYLMRTLIQNYHLRDCVVSFVTIGFDNIFGDSPTFISPVFSLFLNYTTPEQLNHIVQILKESHLFPFLITEQHFNLFLNPILNRIKLGQKVDFSQITLINEYTKSLFREAKICLKSPGKFCYSKNILDLCITYSLNILDLIDEFLEKSGSKSPILFIDFINMFIFNIQSICKEPKFSVFITSKLLEILKKFPIYFKNQEHPEKVNKLYFIYTKCFVLLLRAINSLLACDFDKFNKFHELLLIFKDNKEKRVQEFDPEKIIGDVYKSVKNPINRTIKGDDKKREGKTFLAMSQSLKLKELVAKMPEFSPELKPIAQFVYKLRLTLKESKQATIAYNDSDMQKPPTLKQQYPFFLQIITEKIDFLYNSNIEIENTEENMKLLSTFISSELPLSEFTDLLTLINDMKENIIFTLKCINDLIKCGKLPLAFIFSISDFISSDNSLLEAIEILSALTDIEKEFSEYCIEIITAFIDFIPAIDSTIVIAFISKFSFIVSKCFTTKAIMQIFTAAIDKIIKNNDKISQDQMEVSIVFLLLLKSVIQEENKVPESERCYEEVDNLMKTLPPSLSFSIPIATALLISGQKTLLKPEEIVCLFYSESPDYHLLLQYIKAYIMTNDDNQLIYSTLLNFIGSVFCGKNVDILRSWISMYNVHPSEIGMRVKTPEILLAIACDTITMFREILAEEESPASKEFCKLAINLIIKEENRKKNVKMLIAILSILSNMIEERRKYSIVKDRKENMNYLITSIKEKFMMIEGISIPINGDIKLSSIPINGDYSYESIVRFKPSLFKYFTIMFNLFSETINAPKSYSDSILSFFTLGCLREYITDPYEGDSFALQLSSTMNNMSVKSFEFRQFSNHVIKLISLALTNSADGVFSKSPVKPEIKHISFTRYINTNDFRLYNDEIKTFNGIHCFMSTILDNEMTSYFSFDVSANTRIFFGVIMHSIDLNQTLTIFYSTKKGVFLMNGKVIKEYKINGSEIIEFKYDPLKSKVSAASSTSSQRILSVRIPKGRCSFYATLPKGTTVKYNCSLTPLTDNMKKTTIKLKHVFHPLVMLGRVKTKMFGIKEPVVKEADQKFDMIKVGIDDEDTNRSTLYMWHEYDSIYTFAPTTLHLTNTKVDLNFPTHLVSASRPSSILSTSQNMSQFLEIDSVDGTLSACSADVACMNQFNFIPDMHFTNFYSMPDDIINSLLSGVCEVYKREIITVIIAKLLSSDNPIEHTLPLFSFTYPLIVDFCIGNMVMLEPIKLSNYEDQKSPIDFKTSILSSSFTCQNANLFDHYTGLKKVIEYIQNNTKYISQVMKSWMNCIEKMFSNPNMHFVTQSNHCAIISRQRNVKIIDQNVVGWAAFHTNLGKCVAPYVNGYVFPAPNIKASYSYVPGPTLEYRAQNKDDIVFLPFKNHSNESLTNSFFELIIAIKYFIILLKDNESKLPKGFVKESVFKILNNIYVSVIGRSPFFYSHWSELINFITETLPYGPLDITKSYIRNVEQISRVAGSVSESFSSFINMQMLLEEERSMISVSRFFPSFIPAGTELNTNKREFYLPDATVSYSFSDDSLKAFSLIKRILGHYNNLRSYPFFLILTDWVISFAMYPPCNLTVLNERTLKVEFTSNYIPTQFGLKSSVPGLVNKNVIVSESSNFSNCKEVIPKKYFATPGRVFYMRFGENDNISNAKIVGVSWRKGCSLEDIALDNISKFEEDVKVFANMFTSKEDQMILLGFDNSLFRKSSIDLFQDPINFPEKISKEMHMIDLRLKYLLVFNWIIYQHPSYTEDESFAHYRRYVSMMRNVERFKELVRRSDTSIRGNIRVDRQRGNAVRSGISKKLEDSMIAQFAKAYRNPKDFRNPEQPFHVVFKNESGIDCGGLSRDFTTELVRDIGDQNVGLFVVTPNARNRIGSYRECIVPSPAPHYRNTYRCYYAIGALIAISIRSGMVQPFNFPPLFWSFLLAENISIEDVFEIDEEYKNLIKSLEDGMKMSDEEFRNHFNITNKVKNARGDFITISSLSTVITKSTCQRYISLCNSIRLQELTTPLKAVKNGFWEALALRPLSFVTPDLLEYLACGEKTISVSKLKSLTKFYDVPRSQQNMFWEMMSMMDESQKKKLLRFATGTMCIPADAQYPFFIVDFINVPVDSRLPSASTCFYKLHMPPFSSARKMMEKVVIATEYTGTFELS